MGQAIKSVRPRHHLIIQYAFNGLRNSEIANKVGMSPASISCVLRSPAAQAELARLNNLATEKTTDIPARVALHNELTGAAVDGLRINRALMRDPYVKPETRSRIGQHFMDRVIFNRNSDDEEGESYRDILRKLDRLQATVEPKSILDMELIPLPSFTVEPELADLTKIDGESGNGNGNGIGKHVIDLGEDD